MVRPRLYCKERHTSSVYLRTKKPAFQQVLYGAPNRNRTCIFSSAGILGSCLFGCFIVGETRIVKNVISPVSKKCPFSENGLFSPLWQFGGKACYNLAKVFSEYAVRAVKSSVKIGGKVIIRESLTTFKCLFSNLHMF